MGDKLLPFTYLNASINLQPLIIYNVLNEFQLWATLFYVLYEHGSS